MSAKKFDLENIPDGLLELLDKTEKMGYRLGYASGANDASIAWIKAIGANEGWEPDKVTDYLIMAFKTQPDPREPDSTYGDTMRYYKNRKSQQT